ncbi:MAG TPA: homoserine dehydrogenase [Planctomycetota bacterium]|nr:homoserine dehydrogenase [Planctomycetota bacterium]
MTSPFKIGMIGCGTVGSGVLELLHRREEDLTRLLGRPIRVVRIVVRDPGRPRHHLAALTSSGVELSADPRSVTRGDGVDCVVEVAGGKDAPRDWMLDALLHKRDVVTANKAALAFHGAEIFAAAREAGRTVFYEASVAAAIPIIEMLQSGLVGNQMSRLSGILNGTCNYILTRMEFDRLEYAAALAEAQAKGFAEADPTLDVSGGDSAHKLALLAGIVTRSHIPIEKIYTEGLDGITREDIEFGRTLQYRIKMLAIARRNDQGAWELRVHPTLIPADSILAQVRDEFNAVHLKGDAVGPMLVYGKGAGALPTASSVVADIVRAARREGSAADSRPEGKKPARLPELVPIEKVELRNYIRMTVLDVPGVLGRITSFLGLRHISISSIHQPDAKIGQPVPVVLVTHKTADRVVTDALRDLEKANLLLKPATRIRIEE